ncbi:MAG: hypothetical protein Q9181_006179 [Wetmoreana brouardii]
MSTSGVPNTRDLSAHQIPHTLIRKLHYLFAFHLPVDLTVRNPQITAAVPREFGDDMDDVEYYPEGHTFNATFSDESGDSDDFDHYNPKTGQYLTEDDGPDPSNVSQFPAKMKAKTKAAPSTPTHVCQELGFGGAGAIATAPQARAVDVEMSDP